MLNYSNIISLIINAVVVLVAITLHEFSHGLAAYLLGDTTPKIYNRLTINPFKHLDVVGAICLLVFKFGWAKPVPINPMNFKNYKRDICIVSLAGPLCNLILAFISMSILFFFKITNLYLNILLLSAVYMNIGLAVFNLIPLPPLDGSKVLACFLKSGTQYRYLSLERYSMLILLGLLILPGVKNIFSNILSFLVNGIFNGYLYILEFISGVFNNGNFF